MIWRRNRISASTETRSFGVPENGAPGVDSSIYRPYSGWNVGMVALELALGAMLRGRTGV